MSGFYCPSCGLGFEEDETEEFTDHCESCMDRDVEPLLPAVFVYA